MRQHDKTEMTNLWLTDGGGGASILNEIKYFDFKMLSFLW